MNRREFIKYGSMAGISLGVNGCIHKPDMKTNNELEAARNLDKPNVLFIFSDQQRHDTLSCCENSIFPGLTPNLDMMAGQGVRFKNAFTPQPVCGPARTCLQTGKYATQVGCFRNGMSLPRDEKTMAHWMSQAGYEVGYIGKWHLASDLGKKQYPDGEVNYRMLPVPPERRGGYKDFWLASDVLEFTSTGYHGHMFDENGIKRQYQDKYRVDAQTDWTIEYLRNRKTQKPFFLFVSYIEPHQQNDLRRFYGPEGSKEKYKNYNVPGDLVGTKGNWRKNMPDYLGCCASLDENVGRLLAELDIQGVADNTLVIYTSDHACHFATRNSEYKRACHDNAIHIPMIIRGPGFTGGKVIDELVSLIDLAPTVLSAGQRDIPQSVEGKALQDLAAAKQTKSREYVFVQISESQVGRALRTRRWTYSVTAPEKDGGSDAYSNEYVEDFLYDNRNDPYQRNNLVTDPGYSNIRKTLADMLIQKIFRVENIRPTIKPVDKYTRSSLK